ncbi:hypothetical protein T12_13485 [Trichinella patagoniensis]|uniref:Uncharacterized protein n=1 Tax=Trichinella patagoniensis TaxID=990121 RepID=A0A0V0ZQ94_9BILA|nr:hypothetical protein T12_13485 [Trichinella patagoniensis]
MFIIFTLVTFGPPRWAMTKFGMNMVLFHSVVNEAAVGFSIFSYHRRIHLRDREGFLNNVYFPKTVN